MRQEPLAGLGSVCTKEEIAALQKQCQEIYIHGDLLDYMIEIVRATRRHEKAEYGVSPAISSFVHTLPRPASGSCLIKRSAMASSCDFVISSIEIRIFGRVQFTPDLLPSDVTGLNYYDAGKGDTHQKTIHLCLRQRKCPQIFHWILCCNNEKHRFQRPCYPVNRHLILRHAFQKAALCFWRREAHWHL